MLRTCARYVAVAVGVMALGCAAAWLQNIANALVGAKAPPGASLWRLLTTIDQSTISTLIPLYTLGFILFALWHISRERASMTLPLTPAWPFGKQFCGNTLLLGFLGTLLGVLIMFAQGAVQRLDDLLPGMKTAVVSMIAAIVVSLAVQAIGPILRAWYARAHGLSPSAVPTPAPAGVLAELRTLGAALHQVVQLVGALGRKLVAVTAAVESMQAGLESTRSELDVFRNRTGVDMAEVIQQSHRQLVDLCTTMQTMIQESARETAARKALADQQHETLVALGRQLEAGAAARQAIEEEKTRAVTAMTICWTKLGQLRSILNNNP